MSDLNKPDSELKKEKQKLSDTLHGLLDSEPSKLDKYIGMLDKYIENRENGTKATGQDFSKLFRWYKVASRRINKTLAEKLRTELLSIKNSLQSEGPKYIPIAQQKLQELLKQSNIHQLRKKSGGSVFGPIHSQELNKIIKTIKESEDKDQSPSLRKG